LNLTSIVRAAIIAAMASTALAACSQGDAAQTGHGNAAHSPAPTATAEQTAGASDVAGGTAEAGAIRIVAATFRPPPAGRDVTAAYFRVTNTGATADAIIGAASAAAASIELHTHTHEGGMMVMRKVDSVDLPADGTVDFEPGGLHLMLFGAGPALQGSGPVPITLSLRSGGQIEVGFLPMAPATAQ
jgi:periplasmic copper chaperone A